MDYISALNGNAIEQFRKSAEAFLAKHPKLDGVIFGVNVYETHDDQRKSVFRPISKLICYNELENLQMDAADLIANGYTPHVVYSNSIQPMRIKH